MNLDNIQGNAEFQSAMSLETHLLSADDAATATTAGMAAESDCRGVDSWPI